MKTFFKISAGIVCVSVIGLTGVYMGRDALIKKTVETAGPKFLQTSVTLGKVDFRPVQGHLTLQDLHIGNPKGFSDRDLFALKSISIDLQPKTLFGNKIIINKIMIDNVSAHYEIANGTNNIAVVQKNVAGKPKPASAKSAVPAAKETGKPEKTVVIKDLTLKDAEVSAAISGISMSLPLPTIHMKDIGENKPSTFKEALASVLNVFSTETLKAIAGATSEAVKSGSDSIGKLLKKIF